MHKRLAFTLAEVLITLGILGVVAVLTLPSLISKYKEKVLETRYNRAKAVITNVAQMRIAKYNLDKYEDYIAISDDMQLVLPCFKFLEENDYEAAEKCAMEKEFDFYAWGFNNIVSFPAENMNSVKYNTDKQISSWNELRYTFTTADGISYGIYNSVGSTMLVDTNSSKLPNEPKKDMFLFEISSNLKVTDITDLFICSLENPSACDTQKCSALIEKKDKNGNGYASAKDGGCYYLQPVTDTSTNCISSYYPSGSIECQNLK